MLIGLGGGLAVAGLVISVVGLALTYGLSLML